MTDIRWTHPSLSEILKAIPLDTRSLIDLGSGRGIIGAICRIYRDVGRLVGVDGYLLSVDFCKRFNFYDEYLVRDLKTLPLPFKSKEFDVATCVEVIEHLPKEQGEKLIAEMERIAGLVILTTPNIFFEQPEYDENPYQKHISYWTVHDFKKRGYEVYGIGDMKIFGRIVKDLSHALGSMTKYTPIFSSGLLCIKKTQNIKMV